MGLSELMAQQDGGDFLRAVAEAVLPLLMEAGVKGWLARASMNVLTASWPSGPGPPGGVAHAT